MSWWCGICSAGERPATSIPVFFAANSGCGKNLSNIVKNLPENEMLVVCAEDEKVKRLKFKLIQKNDLKSG